MLTKTELDKFLKLTEDCADLFNTLSAQQVRSIHVPIAELVFRAFRCLSAASTYLSADYDFEPSQMQRYSMIYQRKVRLMETLRSLRVLLKQEGDFADDLPF